MTIQNYYLKEIIKNRQITNQLFEDKEDETANTTPFQLKSSNKIRVCNAYLHNGCLRQLQRRFILHIL